MKKKIGVALYGINGHQIHHSLVSHPAAKLVAVAAIDRAQLPPVLREHSEVAHYSSLEEILSDERVELISLCSPRRREQAAQTCACLEAGKHVLAEKPCAMTEADLDQILATAERTGKHFHEMTDTSFEQPYVAMRTVVDSGVLGEIIQVFAQKSYPYHDRRPQDEDIDGGLILQVGVHAIRMIEHVAGQRIATIDAVQTGLGNPVAEGGLQMAASLMMRLEAGGVASVVLNYVNPKGLGRWGNEHLRIFGTNGFVESTDGGTRTRLIVGTADRGALDTSAPVTSYFDRFIHHLQDGTPMPLSSEEETHPTRILIRAREKAQ